MAVQKTETFIPSVKFNKLTKEQYDQAVLNGEIQPTEFYLVEELNDNFGDMMKKIYDPQNKSTDIFASIPNPNLLDNSDFSNPVNQRGKEAYYDNGYMIDRWVNNASAYNVKDHYMASGSPDATKYIFQALELSKIAEIGDKLTASARINGETISVTAEITAGKGSSNVVSTSDGKASIVFSWNNTNDRIYFRINDLVASGAVFLYWVKLELGDVATPWQPKGYGVELNECMRYYRAFPGIHYGFSFQDEVGNYILELFLCPPMRAAPIVTFTDKDSKNVSILRKTANDIVFIAQDPNNKIGFRVENIIVSADL